MRLSTDSVFEYRGEGVFTDSTLQRDELPIVAADFQISVIGSGTGEVFDGFCSPSRRC